MTKTRVGLPNTVLTDATWANLQEVGPPEYGEQARGFAREIQSGLGIAPMADPFAAANTKLTPPSEFEAGLRHFLPPWQWHLSADDYVEFCWHCPTVRLLTARPRLRAPDANTDYPMWSYNALGGLPAAIECQAEDFTQRFHGARADSSRVRAALGRIAVQRWESEAYWWGHGNVERGPHLVEYMPIGSHHTWYGLLFVKGLVGAIALAVPMAWTAWMLLIGGRSSKAGVSAFGILMILGLYSLSENLEMLAYLYWPALMVLGMGLRDVARSRNTSPTPAAESAQPPLLATTP